MHYKPDGSGRDRYIALNSGGSFNTLSNNFDTRIAFMKSLRSYSKSRAEMPRKYKQHSPEVNKETVSTKHQSQLSNYQQMRSAAKSLRKASQMRMSVQEKPLPKVDNLFLTSSYNVSPSKTKFELSFDEQENGR